MSSEILTSTNTVPVGDSAATALFVFDCWCVSVCLLLEGGHLSFYVFSCFHFQFSLSLSSLSLRLSLSHCQSHSPALTLPPSLPPSLPLSLSLSISLFLVRSLSLSLSFHRSRSVSLCLSLSLSLARSLARSLAHLLWSHCGKDTTLARAALLNNVCSLPQVGSEYSIINWII